ncbi:hypothetical protein HN51_055901 [Arachis hypogaea]
MPPFRRNELEPLIDRKLVNLMFELVFESRSFHASAHVTSPSEPASTAIGTGASRPSSSGISLRPIVLSKEATEAINDEPICPRPFSFDFEHPTCTEEDVKEFIWRESVKFNPDPPSH